MRDSDDPDPKPKQPWRIAPSIGIFKRRAPATIRSADKIKKFVAELCDLTKWEKDWRLEKCAE